MFHILQVLHNFHPSSLPLVPPSDSDYEALQRELEKIRKEKEEQAKKKEEEAAAEEEERRQEAVAEANPLMNTNQSLKRRWDDDTVFKNQAQKAPKVGERYWILTLFLDIGFRREPG